MKRKDISAGLFLVMFIAAVLVPFASQMPDGLEKVAADQGFSSKESENPAVAAPFADYRVPGIGSDKISAVLSGIIGALAMFCTGWGIAALLRRRKTR